jgi:hypothetical protein
MHVHTSYMHTCMHTYMHACMHAYTCTYLHTCTPTYIRTLVHMCVPTYMPTYTYSIGAYTFTHTCTHVVHCLALARAALMYRSAPLPPPNHGVSTRSLVSPTTASLRQLQLRTHDVHAFGVSMGVGTTLRSGVLARGCAWECWHEVAPGSVGTRLRLGVLARGCAWECRHEAAPGGVGARVRRPCCQGLLARVCASCSLLGGVGTGSANTS